MDILQAIGNTSMVRLRNIVPGNGAEIFAKLEWENPTGSMKDRMAHAVTVRETKHTAGIYAGVVGEGEVRVGDEIALLT